MPRIIILLLLITSCISNDEHLHQPLDFQAKTEINSPTLPDSTVIDHAGKELISRILPPSGFERVDYPAGTFGYYLRHLPLKPAGSKVLLFDGREKYRQDVHAAVFDIDVGKRDLQQCADAVMRLRAEYLWQAGRFEDIQFSFTNGFAAPYHRWRSGERIRVAGNHVSWVKRTGPSESYASFRSYLNMVFAYAGTISLAQELSEQKLSKIEAGDVFIQSGSPGHAVLVMDKAVHPQTGEIMILLAQSYMPAQDIHLLRNFGDGALSPWYSIPSFTEVVNTPEWRFQAGDLKQF